MKPETMLEDAVREASSAVVLAYNVNTNVPVALTGKAVSDLLASGDSGLWNEFVERFQRGGWEFAWSGGGMVPCLVAGSIRMLGKANAIGLARGSLCAGQ